MMGRIMKKYLFIALIYAKTVAVSFAGITGTFAGRITDKNTQQPLPGANITLIDTYYGAAAEGDGFFLINNIPAGRYRIKVEMMGYQTIILNDVHILMDLRTTHNFEMDLKVLDGEQVSVTAERPMIQKDVTATAHFISQQEISQLPVQSFTEIIDIQPGVAAGHIRGGRQNEVLYLVDGFPIQDVIEGKIGAELPMNSIIDMTVQTGGFNAEYGNAMSGVVNILTQDGGQDLESMVEVSALHYAGRETPFTTDGANTDWITECYIGGPLLTQKLKFYLSADIRMPNTRWKREEFGQRLMIFNNSASKNINMNSKISFHPWKSLKITTQGLLSLWEWTEFDNKWKKNIPGLPERTKNSYRFSLTAVHTINPQTFYEVRASVYNVLKSINGASSLDMANVKYEDPIKKDWVISGDYPWWLDHEEIHTMGKIDLTSQITNNHQIKTGMEFTYYDLYKKNVQRLEVKTYDPAFPQYISYDTEYQYYPYRGAAYIQDKIEYEGMIANIGLRYDFMNPRAQRPAVEEKIYGDRSDWIINNEKQTKAEMKHQWSPRIGIALPMGTKQELRVNYGYFFQTPMFDYLYTNANINLSQGFSPLGDPDLKPSKTLSYELSYKNQLTHHTLLDITIFNKEVSNLIDNNTFLDRKSDALSGSGYTRYVNMENVSIWGSEIYFKRRVTQFLSGKISHTYMIAKGTGSENTEKFSWLTNDTKVPISDYYLSWDQRHTIVANIDMRKPNNWGINILWKWNSPLPYTEYLGISTTPNNARMESSTTLDIRVNKDFKIINIPASFFLEALNVFDHSNILWVDYNGIPGGIYSDPSAWDGKFRLRAGFGIQL